MSEIELSAVASFQRPDPEFVQEVSAGHNQPYEIPSQEFSANIIFPFCSNRGILRMQACSAARLYFERAGGAVQNAEDVGARRPAQANRGTWLEGLRRRRGNDRRP